jgi:hypothetical protein
MINNTLKYNRLIDNIVSVKMEVIISAMGDFAGEGKIFQVGKNTIRRKKKIIFPQKV